MLQSVQNYTHPFWITLPFQRDWQNNYFGGQLFANFVYIVALKIYDVKYIFC